MTEHTIGIIAGSGLPELKGLLHGEKIEVTTPFGTPSSPISTGTLNGVDVAFLNRHGPGHTLTPNEINYRANIFALKDLGVTRIIAVSACGSLRDDFALGDFVVPDQLYDLTHRREKSFFGGGIVTHINVADPFCGDLTNRLSASTKEAGFQVHCTGSYIAIEGTRFSTRAESNTYRAWGMSVVGMTAAPEAFLAREAEMCYAILVYISNYDVWHLDEDPVSANRVLQSIRDTGTAITDVINLAVQRLTDTSNCACSHALDNAFFSDPTAIPQSKREKLAPLLNRYFQARKLD